MGNDQENYKLAFQLQKEGKCADAIAAANQITAPAFRAGILVDCGGHLGKPALVREGISLFQDVLKSNQTRISRASLLYNIGNGFSEIYKIRQAQNSRVVAPNDDDLRMAKKAYRQSLAESKLSFTGASAFA